MPKSRIKNIGVVGAGVMGGGIAQVFALHNFSVTLVDRTDEAIRKTLGRIKEHTAPELWDGVVSRINTSTSLEELGGCGLVIEAVPEDPEMKKELFRDLNAIAMKDALVATNTSAISINELSRAVKNPERFLGMHFMNPPKVMKLVEVIRGDRTSDETLRSAIELIEEIEKIPAIVKDSPGFVSNRLLFALIGEAMRALESGIAEKEAIDTVMKYGMNHPMGPIELADFIGLDVCRDTMRYIYEHLNDSKFKPPVILEKLVREGKLGRKTGEGFYRYA